MIGPMTALVVMSLVVIGQASFTAFCYSLSKKRIKKPSKMAIKFYIWAFILTLLTKISFTFSTFEWDPLFFRLLAECFFIILVIVFFLGMIIQFAHSIEFEDDSGKDTKFIIWNPEYRPPLLGYGYIMYHAFYYFELLSYIGQYPWAWILSKFGK